MATIDGKTLAQAIQDAPVGVPTTITLASDESTLVNLYATVDAGKIITIDLNGCKVTQSPTSGESYLINNKGKLVIIDSSASKNGALIVATGTPSWSYASNVILNSGEFVLESGTLRNDINGTGYAHCLDNVDNGAQAKAVINGGKLLSTGARSNGNIRLHDLDNAFSNEVVINGGELENGGYAPSIYMQYGGGTSQAKLEINNVEVKSVGTAPYAIYFNADTAGTNAANTIEINGGNFRYVGDLIRMDEANIAVKPTQFIVAGTFFGESASIVANIGPNSTMVVDPATGKIIVVDSALNDFKFLSGKGLKVVWDKIKERFTLKDGEAINIDANNKVNVKLDKKTLVLDVDGKLETAVGGFKDSEGVHFIKNEFVNIDNKSIILDSEGKLAVSFEDVKIDNETILVNSEGELKTRLGGFVDSEGKIHFADNSLIKKDEKTIILDADGALQTALGGYEDSEGIHFAENRFINIDNVTIILDSEGKLAAVPEPLKDGIATKARYDGKNEVIDVVFDEESIVLNSEGELKVDPAALIDDKMIILDSEGKLRTRIGGWIGTGTVISTVATMASEPPIDSEGKKYSYAADTSAIQGSMGFEAEFDAMITSHTYKKTATFTRVFPRNVYEFVDSDDRITWLLDAENNVLNAEFTAGVMPVAPYINGKLTTKVVTPNVVHFVDNQFINTDREVIILDSEGRLTIKPISVADVKAMWEALI